MTIEKIPGITGYKVPALLASKVVYTACVDGKEFDFTTKSNAAVARRVESIVNKALANEEPLTPVERFALLNAVFTCLHESGKVEGATSINTSCESSRACQCRINNPDLICNKCYSNSQQEWQAGTREKAIISSWILNSIIFTVGEWQFANIYTNIIRVESFGDCSSVKHACNMTNIALAFPAKRVGIWTKNPAFYERVWDETGKPENVSFGYSAPEVAKIPVISGKSWYKYVDFVFAVMLPSSKKTPNIGLTLNCERVSITCGGKKCRTCSNYGKGGYSCYHLNRDENGNEPYTVYELLK